jgi:hypothetical protein
VILISSNTIALITLLATIGVPLLIYWLSRNKKELSYKIFTSTLLSEKQEFREKLRVFIDDQEIKEDISLILLTIINSGNTPIKVEDFAEGIYINLVGEGRFLQSEVKSSNPSYLPVKIDEGLLSLNLFSIEPLLLNKGDEFTLKILGTQVGDNIEVSSRIVGIKEISKYKPPLFTKFEYSVIVLFFLVFAVSLVFFKDENGLSPTFLSITTGGLLAIFSNVMLSVIKFFKRKNKDG